jgi:AAA domain
MAILSFAMQKGSVGKTTTTLAVGVELAQLGARVLLVDIDPQSNLTQALGYDPTQLQQSIHNVLLNPTHSLDAATLHTEHGVDLVPATLVLAGAELTLASVFGRELRLRTALIDQQITAANQADKTMVCEVVLAIAAKRPGQQQHFCADRGMTTLMYIRLSWVRAIRHTASIDDGVAKRLQPCSRPSRLIHDIFG